jgi:hypothetical protein
MMRKGIRLSRRAALKGLGGFTLGLPLLECMLDGKDAWAQAAPPKRYLVFFDGQSLGGDDDTVDSELVPNTVGANYDLKTATQPLGALASEVSIISGLKIPWAGENGGVVPAGGRPDPHHVQSLSPLLCGVRSVTGTTRCEGPTSDQIVASAIAGNTTFKSLQYRVQADWYLSVSAPYGRDIISYSAGGNAGAMPAEISPQQAFRSLFGTFTPPGVDPAAAAAFDFNLRQRRSVLDLVVGHTATLVPKLGKADQQRLQRHLDELRALEMRVAATPPPQTSLCVKPMDPGADPAIGTAQPYDMTSMSNGYSQNDGYSGEDQRAGVFCDLIHMAMCCDLTRVVSLQMTMFQSHMNMFSIVCPGQTTPLATDLHELGHGGAPGSATHNVSLGIAWHMKWYAYLINKFKSTPEGSGTMLDNVAMPMLFEGGHGQDPEAGKMNSSHSTENMAVLLAGRAGGLKPGKHVVKTGMHPGNVLISAMNAVGYTGNTLGEVTGAIPELFT